MHPSDKARIIIDTWAEKLANSRKLVIIEGPHDEHALHLLEITNTYTLNKKPLYKVVEEVAKQSTEVIILTDFDTEGKKLHSTLNTDLQKHKIKVDSYFREFLHLNTSIRHIEHLTGYIKNLDKKSQRF